jgi:hypothetical protein
MIGKIHMQNPQKRAQFQMALSQWDTEGGAGPCGPQDGSRTLPLKSDLITLTDSEIVQLRFRVIALENLIIAVQGAKGKLTDLKAGFSEAAILYAQTLTRII